MPPRPPAEQADPARPAAAEPQDQRPGGRVHRHHLTVQWGDTDPAKIVFYPRFFAWFDESTHALFESAGVDWDTLMARSGIVGVPLVSASATFHRPAVFRDALTIESTVTRWNTTSFVVSHRVVRGTTLIAEGTETRVWATHHPTDPKRLRPTRIPPGDPCRLRRLKGRGRASRPTGRSRRCQRRVRRQASRRWPDGPGSRVRRRGGPDGHDREGCRVVATSVVWWRTRLVSSGANSARIWRTRTSPRGPRAL